MGNEVRRYATREHAREPVREQGTADYSNYAYCVLVERLIQGVRQTSRDDESVSDRNEHDRNDRAHFCEQTIAEGGKPTVTAGLSRRRSQLFDAERRRPSTVVPRETENSTTALRLHSDHELIDRRICCRLRQIHTREILVGVVVSAPLPCLTIEDQLSAGWCRDRPQCVFPGRNNSGPERQILVGGEDRRRVGTRPPHLIPWNDVAEDYAPA